MVYTGLIVFTLAIIGVGLFISSLVSTQQQAMLGAMVYMMPAMELWASQDPVQNMPTGCNRSASEPAHAFPRDRARRSRDMPMALVPERIWPMAVIAVFTLTAASWLFRRNSGESPSFLTGSTGNLYPANGGICLSICPLRFVFSFMLKDLMGKLLAVR